MRSTAYLFSAICNQLSASPQETSPRGHRGLSRPTASTQAKLVPLLLVAFVVGGGHAAHAGPEETRSTEIGGAEHAAKPSDVNDAADKVLPLRYGDELGRYRLTAGIDLNMMGHLLKMASLSLDLEWQRAARVKDTQAFHVSAFALSLDAPGQKIMASLDSTRLFHQVNDKVEIDITAGNEGKGGLSLAKLTSEPLFNVPFDAHGPARPKYNANHTFSNKGLGDMSATSIFCFPTFPKEPVTIGSTWTNTRLVPLSKKVSHNIKVDLVYTAESTRPCGEDTCVVIRFHGDTGKVKTTYGSRPTKLRYVFEGTALFALGAGRLMSSNFKLLMTLQQRGPEVPLEGTYDLVVRD